MFENDSPMYSFIEKNHNEWCRLARDNLAQDGQKLCPWLDSLTLAYTDPKISLSFSLLVARKRVR